MPFDGCGSEVRLPMEVKAYKLRSLVPPKDEIREAILASRISIKEGDVVAISSKVMSISEGRCVAIDYSLDPKELTKQREMLIKSEADWYFPAPKTSLWHRYFTIAKGILIGSSGIDESNGNGHYILYLTDPFKSAQQLRAWLMKTYKVKKLAVIITDSASTPLRRGAIGIALAWYGLDPLKDYKRTKDLFGREIKFEMANIIDALAASAVLAMGEGNEQTPIAIIRDAKNIVFKNRSPKIPEQLIVPPSEDIYAPLFWREGKGWKNTNNE